MDKSNTNLDTFKAPGALIREKLAEEGNAALHEVTRNKELINKLTAKEFISKYAGANLPYYDNQDACEMRKKLMSFTEADLNRPSLASPTNMMGNFGEVRLVTFKRKVAAVKCFKFSKRCHRGPHGNNDFNEVFNELLVMQYVQPHPNFLTYFGFNYSPFELFIALEYAPFGTLLELLNDHSNFEKLPNPLILAWASDILSAIQHMHNQDIHQIMTVNPAHFLVSDDLQLKFYDFGLAKQNALFSIQMPESLENQLPYMAPEVGIGKNSSPGSHLFSFAMIVVRMVNRRPLVVENIFMQIEEASMILSDLKEFGCFRQLLHHCVKYEDGLDASILRPTATEALQEVLRILSVNGGDLRNITSVHYEISNSFLQKLEEVYKNGSCSDYCVDFRDSNDDAYERVNDPQRYLSSYAVKRPKYEEPPLPLNKLSTQECISLLQYLGCVERNVSSKIYERRFSGQELQFVGSKPELKELIGSEFIEDDPDVLGFALRRIKKMRDSGVRKACLEPDAIYTDSSDCSSDDEDAHSEFGGPFVIKDEFGKFGNVTSRKNQRGFIETTDLGFSSDSESDCNPPPFKASRKISVSKKTSAPQFFATNETIRIAVNLWCTDMKKAKSIYGPIGKWNTREVSDMNKLFYNLDSFNDNIDSWDVSNVIDMSEMFACVSAVGMGFAKTSSFNKPLACWDVRRVKNMKGMFKGASNFNQPLDSWDVSSVVNMSSMFDGALKFNQSLGSWNVSNVTDMSHMIFKASKFDQTIESWNVGNVTSMYGMFRDASSFNEGLEKWNVGKVTDMNAMFKGAVKFNKPLGGWNVGEVVTMSAMFSGAIKFNQPLNKWNIGKVTNMSFMFNDASKFNQSLDKWNVHHAANTTNMFTGAIKFNKSIHGPISKK
jgi:surface protein